MKCGLALAAADALQCGAEIQRITIRSEDESRVMKHIGRKIWCEFVEQLKKAAEREDSSDLRVVSYACEAIVCHGPIDSSEIPLWLSVLHVTYKKNMSEVSRDVDCIVKQWEPDVVLVTSNPIVSGYQHKLTPAMNLMEQTFAELFSENEGNLIISSHEGVSFIRVKRLRQKSHSTYVGKCHMNPSSENCKVNYLKYGSSWAPRWWFRGCERSFSAKASCYSRQ